MSLVKHAHHEFDIDQPGKDSFLHREAGCEEVLITSSARWALMHELHGAKELSVDEAIARISPCDLLLIEGFKTAPIPKLEIYRRSLGKPLLHPDDPHILAIASDGALTTLLPHFEIDDVDDISAFVLQHSRVL